MNTERAVRGEKYVGKGMVLGFERVGPEFLAQAAWREKEMSNEALTLRKGFE